MNNAQTANRINDLNAMKKGIDAELKSLKSSLMNQCEDNYTHHFGAFEVKLSVYSQDRLDSKAVKQFYPEVYEENVKSIETRKLYIKEVIAIA